MYVMIICILKRYRKGENIMNENKLKEILDNHKLWLKTEGEQGKKADLKEVVLYGANLRGQDLRFANLSGINLEEADLSGTKLMGADLSDSDLCGANFSSADLSGANLGGADFSETDLRGASLEGANLSGVDLRGADLKGASLEFAAFPLWDGGTDVNIDDKQVKELLYHLLKNVSCSKNVSEELKTLLLKEELIDKANESYLAKDCGMI